METGKIGLKEEEEEEAATEDCVVTHTSNVSIWKVEADGSMVQGHPEAGLLYETLSPKEKQVKVSPW